MAKAKKLPSGSWRCLVYSHTERVLDPKTGQIKDKRVYESFTSNDPGPRGRKEAELAAARFQMEKTKNSARKYYEYGNMTLSEAIDRYIESRESLDRSPTTSIEEQKVFALFSYHLSHFSGYGVRCKKKKFYAKREGANEEETRLAEESRKTQDEGKR